MLFLIFSFLFLHFICVPWNLVMSTLASHIPQNVNNAQTLFLNHSYIMSSFLDSQTCLTFLTCTDLQMQHLTTTAKLKICPAIFWILIPPRVKFPQHRFALVLNWNVPRVRYCSVALFWAPMETNLGPCDPWRHCCQITHSFNYFTVCLRALICSVAFKRRQLMAAQLQERKFTRETRLNFLIEKKGS